VTALARKTTVAAPVAERVAAADWTRASDDLDAQGFAMVEGLLDHAVDLVTGAATAHGAPRTEADA